MNLSRRQFFKLAAAGVIGAAVTSQIDIERLLWVPGAKTYHLTPGGNTLITPEWMAKEVLRHLQQNLHFTSMVLRNYDREHVKVGSTINVRIPKRFEVRPGNAYVPQDITSTAKLVVMSDQLAITTGGAWRNHAVASAEAKIIGRKLARAANARGLNVFSALALPVAVSNAVNVTGDKVSVRLVEAYDIATDTTLTRFDVLGGRLA